MIIGQSEQYELHIMRLFFSEQLEVNFAFEALTNQKYQPVDLLDQFVTLLCH